MPQADSKASDYDAPNISKNSCCQPHFALNSTSITNSETVAKIRRAQPRCKSDSKPENDHMKLHSFEPPVVQQLLPPLEPSTPISS
jgi:hypothetical protein